MSRNDPKPKTREKKSEKEEEQNLVGIELIKNSEMEPNS